MLFRSRVIAQLADTDKALNQELRRVTDENGAVLTSLCVPDGELTQVGCSGR